MAKYPTTQAIRLLKANKINFAPLSYKYEDHGGTTQISKLFKIPEYNVIKTLIFEDDKKNPLIVLMHGNHEVSTKNLARKTGAKSISPCLPQIAQKHSGYMVGGTSPFGTKKKMPVYIESTILDLEKIYINGGKRGFVLEIKAEDIVKVLDVVKVEVAI